MKEFLSALIMSEVIDLVDDFMADCQDFIKYY